jgi:hypothetical protein
MELIGDNVYTSALVKFAQNPLSRFRVKLDQSSTNQVADQLINMRGIC